MNNINFTGFKNVGAVTLKVQDPSMPFYRKMIIELTDEGGDHLTRLRRKLEANFPFEKDSNRLHLDVFEFSENSPADRSKYLLSINSKPVEADVKNIEILDEIAELTADIGDSKIQDLFVSKKYLEQPGRLEELTKNNAIKFNIGTPRPIEELYGYKNVKAHGDTFSYIFDSYATSIVTSSN